MRKQKAYITLTIGMLLFLFTTAAIYYDFFVPKIGPLGSGERPVITYIMYGSNILLAAILVFQGAWALRQFKQ